MYVPTISGSIIDLHTHHLPVDPTDQLVEHRTGTADYGSTHVQAFVSMLLK